MKDSKRTSVTQSLVAGGIAGSFAKTCIAPFERVKIIYQVSPDKRFTLTNAGRDMLVIVRTEGFLGLWRGNGLQIARAAPYAGLQYMTFQLVKNRVCQGRTEHMSPAQKFLAGGLAGAVSVTCTYPLDLLRARKAVYRGPLSPSVVEMTKQLWAQQGPLGLYRGLSATLWGIVPYGGLSFGTFETMKGFWLQQSGSAELCLWERMVSGATAGLVAQSVTYPLDVVRRRMQVDGHGGRRVYSGMVHAGRSVYAEEGLRGLYKGLSMNWIKGPLALGVSFTIFDYLSVRMVEWQV